MIGKSLAILTIGSLVGMVVLEGNVQKSFAALHSFMCMFSTLLMLVYVDFDG